MPTPVSVLSIFWPALCQKMVRAEDRAHGAHFGVLMDGWSKSFLNVADTELDIIQRSSVMVVDAEHTIMPGWLQR